MALKPPDAHQPASQPLHDASLPAMLLHIKGNSRRPFAHPPAVQRCWEGQLPSVPHLARLQQNPTAAATAGADPGQVLPGSCCWALAAPPAPWRQQWLWLAARPQSAGQARGGVRSGVAWCHSVDHALAWSGRPWLHDQIRLQQLWQAAHPLPAGSHPPALASC